MKGVVFRGDKKLEILHFDDPIPGPGEAILEMKASGMCGSDLHFYRNKPADVIRWLGFKDLVAGYVGGHTHHRRPRALVSRRIITCRRTPTPCTGGISASC